MDSVDTSSSTLQDKSTEQPEASGSNSAKRCSFKCFLCTRKFSKKALMFQHFDEYHSVSMYKCSKCCKTFDSKASFSLHLKGHEYGYMNISQVQRNYFFCHPHCCVNCSFRGLISSTNIPRLF